MVALTGALGAGGFASAAAQDVQRGEKVEVTGSSIKRIDAETALPVQIITRQEIERSGAQNTEELLKTVSSIVSANSVTQSLASGANTASVSTVSLRGLGGQRTLILVNGRRATVFGGVPGAGGDAAVDVNSIPLSAIERVEVLKDGASAVYGSDAVAGVINFIMRSDYQGGEVSALYGFTSQGGANVSKASATVGFGNLSTDRFNILLNANFQKERPLFGRDRKFSSTSIHVSEENDTTSGNTFPGNVATPGQSTRNPAALAGDCTPSVIDPNFPSNRCRYNPAGEVTLIPDSERSNAMLSGRFAVSDDLTLYADVSAVHNVMKTKIQPAPLSDQFAIPRNNPYIPAQNALYASYPNLATDYPANYPLLVLFPVATFLLPPTSPYYPTAFVAANIPSLVGEPLLIRYRTVPLGGRQFRDVTDVARFVVGAKGTVAGWDYDTGVLYTQSKVKETTTGGIALYTKILPLLNSGVINPFGPSSPAAEQALQGTVFNGLAYSTKTSIGQFDAKASREVYQLPAGPVAVAFGGNVRREKYALQTSPELQAGDTDHYGANNLPVTASRNVEALFAEVNVPLVKGLELDAALRFDKYEKVGTTTNPKVSLRWQPAREFLLRASYGKGFRAPSLTDLYAPTVGGTSAPGLSDPLRCPTTGSSLDCNTQFNITTGGLSSLRPEKSESYTAGLVFEPTANVHLGIDFFKVNISNSIVVGGVGAPVILGSEQFTQQFANRITRGPADPTVPGAYGPIVSIDQTNQNLFDIRIRGIDADFTWRFANNETGRWTLGISGTYFQQYAIQLPDGTYFSAVADNTLTGITGVIPRWKAMHTVMWDRGPFAASLTYNFQAGYQDTPGNLSGLARRVGTYETFDTQASWSGIKNLKLTLGVKNILNRDPPLANADSAGQFQSGYDASYGDPRGRFIYTSATWKFL